MRLCTLSCNPCKPSAASREHLLIHGACTRRDIEAFTEAIHLPFEARVAFLNRACVEEEELRQRIVALLRSYNRAEPLLEQPAAAIGGGRSKADSALRWRWEHLR